jgi:hypothetical protein
MSPKFLALILLSFSCIAPALAQDAKVFEDLEIAVVKGDGDEKVVVQKAGKVLWQSGPKDAAPGSKWSIHALGKDLNGDGHPDMHLTSVSGANTTHHVVQLKPQVKRIAVQPMGGVGGSEFIDVPGRKAPVMISADDSSANVFAPYATSYFPLVVLEVGKGRFQLAKDMMQSRLPGQPPPICATPAPGGNAWLRERCNEFATVRRNERASQVKQRLESVKSTRSADKVKWKDYVDKGAAGAIAAELNRYAYTGHGAAGLNWLEAIWPGNDMNKAELITNLRQTHSQSAFAEDLRGLTSGR